jgi:hypothetical protein
MMAAKEKNRQNQMQRTGSTMRTMVREQWDEGGVSLRRRRCVYGREVAAVVMFPEASLVMAVGGVAASTQHGVGVLCCSRPGTNLSKFSLIHRLPLQMAPLPWETCIATEPTQAGSQ